ncbi:MAG: hypothetical protein KKD38_09240 [Candidatus Delongbacteria bacterium]|nr:hypothetical protein [Candidatus Delongbacteria bacterium]MCG2761121.1 hypothetical protein [Candidatus Delongbacteria bacterium]
MKRLTIILFPFIIFARVFMISDSNLNSRSSGLRNSDFALASYNANNFSNPAFLTDQKDIFFSSTYYNYFTDVNLGNISLLYPGIFIEDCSTGFSLSSINYGNFKDIDSGYEYTPYEIMLTLSQGYMLKNIQMGMNLKYVYSSITTDYNSSAFISDIGSLYKFMDNKITVGLGIFNLGFQLDEYYQSRENVAAFLKTGLCYKLDKLPLNLTAQYEMSFDELSRYAVGLEFDAKKNLIVRAGYDFSGSDKEIGTNSKSEKFSGLALGVTILLDSFGVDVSYLVNGELDDEFSITINFRAVELLK